MGDGVLTSAKAAGQIKLGDLTVNRLGFGAMRITGPGIWGNPSVRQDAIDLLRNLEEMNVNFIDTADAYGPGTSEELIAEALFPYRSVVIATKGGMTRSGPGQWSPDCSPKHLRRACMDSLRRLKLDIIDLYQLHTVDPKVSFEESFNTLLDLQREGFIRHIGLSNIRPEHFTVALNMGGFVSVQNNYNLFNREHDSVLRLCERHGIAFIPYFPMSGNNAMVLENEVVQDMAKRYKITARQLVLAWLLRRSPVMLPIPGTSSIEHFKLNVASADVRLSDEDYARLTNLA